MIRVILSACLLPLALMPLAGCGSKAKNESGNDPPKPPAVAQVDAPAPAPAGGKKSGPGKAGKSSRTADGPNPDPVANPSPYTGGVVTAYELAQEFQADWQRALAKYQGKVVTVAGVVRFITTVQADKQVRLWSGTNDFADGEILFNRKVVHLKFFFGVSGKETLKPVEADSKKRYTAAGLGKDPEYPVITIRGVCRRFAGNGKTADSNQLLFDDCTIVETPSGMDRKAVVGVPARAERVELDKLLAAYADPDNGDRSFKGKAVEVTGYLKNRTLRNPVNVLNLRLDSTRVAIYLQAHMNANDVFKTCNLGQDSQVTVRGVMRGGVVRPISGKEQYVTLDNAEIVAVENTKKKR